MKATNRAGVFVNSGLGYKSFVPAKLPPNPPIKFDLEMQNLLSLADRKLGRLDGITQILPNPDLFVAMYVRKEAVLSSQIEGTQASLADILSAEYNQVEEQRRDDVSEVLNYVKAMNWGLLELEKFPFSLRLIRNIHAKLIQGTRGTNRNPGEFRSSQNWIGPTGCHLNEAIFIPPSVEDMKKAMGELESYFYEQDNMPALVKIAMIHAQFETIHPFLDGNGRMGRLLITFWLCHQNILTKPLLYLSYYFKQHRMEYYDRLMDIRIRGNWEDWLKFFLRGVAEVADEATESAKSILKLKENFSNKLYETDTSNNNYQRLLDILFQSLYIKRSDVVNKLNVSNPTAGSIIDIFCKLGILSDAEPHKTRNKLYVFHDYLYILDKGTELIS